MRQCNTEVTLYFICTRLSLNIVYFVEIWSFLITTESWRFILQLFKIVFSVEVLSESNV